MPALILLWTLTLVLVQVGLWLGTRILADAAILDGRLTWPQSGILSIVIIFISVWLRALRAPAPPE